MKARIATFFFAVFALTRFAHAAPGDLDTTFDTDGIVTTDFGGDDGIGAVAIQADGKIVAAGFFSPDGTLYDFALARYNADGSLDSTFGTGGLVTTDFATGSSDGASSLAIQTDGKIVVAGNVNSGGFDFGLARYNSDGSLDTSFGTNGLVTTPVGGLADLPNSVFLQPDGKIVVVGGASTSGTTQSFAVVRYDSDGSLDTTFDTDGKVTTDFGGGFNTGRVGALQDDGKIIAAGGSNFNDAESTNFAVVRYNSDGGLDSGFGTGGIVRTDFSGDVDVGQGVVIQDDGKIVVAGRADNGSDDDFGLARYDTDGSLDTSFGTGGKVMTPIGTGTNDEGRAVGLLEDGKIVVAGFSNDGSQQNAAVARYDSDGSLDASFGSGGIVVADLSGSNADDQLWSVAIQSDGKIVVGGTFGTFPEDFLLARYLGDAADLGVTKTGTADEAKIGETIGFTLTVTNNGPDPVAGVTLTDTLPAELALDAASLTTSQGTCSGTSTIQCDLETLDNGETATVSYSVSAAAKGEVSNSVSLTGQAEDPDTANNAAQVILRLGLGGGCSLIR